MREKESLNILIRKDYTIFSSLVISKFKAVNEKSYTHIYIKVLILLKEFF